jgi:hypothetical protein
MIVNRKYLVLGVKQITNIVFVGSTTYDCSIPKWALILAYLAVPVKFLSSLYAMCCFDLLSRYFFANPKSIKNNYNKKKIQNKQF